MRIEELKRALVEVSELCVNVKCSSCPLAKRDEANVPYCPLMETEDGINLHEPYEWDVDDWREDVEDEDA